MWREGLGAYKIITEGKKGYRNHPAVKEWIGSDKSLWRVLNITRMEMLNRGYHPKPMPEPVLNLKMTKYKRWQTLQEQIEVLKSKGCKCKIDI